MIKKLKLEGETVMDINVNILRRRRELECFPIINRGKLWYNMLSTQQIAELNTWYKAWLDVTETGEVPDKLTWLENKLETEEILL